MKKILIIAVTIVAVIALGNVVFASAQVSNPPGQPNAACPLGYTCPMSGTMPMGGGHGGRMGGRGIMNDQVPGGMMGTYTNTMPMHGAMMAGQGMLGANGMHEQVMTDVAKKLGLTYAELNTAVQNGQIVAQLAQAKGVTLDDLKKTALDAMEASLADLVKQGVMTQEQADLMLDHMDDMSTFNFEQGFDPGMMGGQGMMGGGAHGLPGRMMGHGAQPAGPQG